MAELLVHIEPWFSWWWFPVPFSSHLSYCGNQALLLSYCAVQGVEKNKLSIMHLASQKSEILFAFRLYLPLCCLVSLSYDYMSYRPWQHMWWSVQTQMLSLFLGKNTVLQHNWSKVVFIIVTSSLFAFFPSISWTGPLVGPWWRKSWAFTRREQTNLLLTEAVCLFQYELTSSFYITHSDVLLFTSGYLFSFYIMLLCFLPLNYH